MASQYPAPGPCVVLPEDTLRCCYYWTDHGPVRLAGVYPNESVVPCDPEDAVCVGCFEGARAAEKRIAKLQQQRPSDQQKVDLARARVTLANIKVAQGRFRYGG